MRQVSALSLLALAQWVVAQEECLSLTTNFPDCALTCIVSAGSEVGCTETTDVACRCTPESSNQIRETALPCIIDGCGLGPINQILSAAASVCACVEENPPGPTTTDDPTSEPTDPPTSTSESVPTTEPPPTTTTAETSETITQPPETTCDTASPCQESADAVPECGKKCIESAAVTDAECTPGDFECRCASADVIQGAAQACVIDGCGVATALQVLESASALCDCVEASPTEPCEGEPTDTSTTDDDGGEETTKTEDTTQPPDTTNPPETTTCEGGTTSDCGPVASTAIPGCAQQCFTSAAPGVGCDVDDYGCQCEEEAQASLTQILVPCVASNCPAASLEAVIAGAASVCACASAPPEGGDCPTTTGDNPPPPTDTDTDEPTDEPTTTCAEATRPDCGPVATSAVPECAQPCFASAAPGVGCGVDDYGCQCEPDALASLSQILVPCVATACPPASIPVVIEGASAVCECANAAPTGGCGGEGPGPGPTHEPPPPTQTGGNPPEPTECVPGSSVDCGPVASSAVPECAQACFTSAAPDVGCGAEDYACQCQPDTQESLTALLVPCVATACDSGELGNIIAGAASVCACATAAPIGGDCPTDGPSEPPSPTDGGGGGGGGGGDGGGDGGGGGGSDDGGDGGDDNDDGGNGGGGGGGGGGDTPGSTLTTELTPEPEPTGGEGEQPGDGGGGGGEEPTGPPTVPGSGSAARFEVGLVAGVFGAFWLAAVAL